MANSSVYYIISCVFLHIFLSLAHKAYGKTCYGVYGCFDDPGEPEAPESPEKMKVRFQLSNRDIRTQVSCYGIDIEILPNKTNVEEFFNVNLPTKVIIPGWLQGGGVEWVRELIKALLAIEDSNVIFVNWRYGSLLVNYPQSKWNTKLLGRMIGEFFNRLSDNFDYDLNNVHIYGHSLGAHAAGIAGAWTNAQIGTITGLDPAGPLFHRAPPSERLDPSDAKFVLILHTDAGHYYETHLGISKSNGHVDLYPNGGNNQPGCEMSHRMINLANSYPGLNQVVDNIFACSHQRAVDLLLESLTNHLCQFVAYKCSTYEDFEKDLCSTCEEDRSNCLIFGPQYFAEDKKPQQGSYFFKTDDTPLYCLREFNYQPLSEVQEEPEITLAPSTTTTSRPENLETELEKEIEEVDPEIESEVEEEIKVIEEEPSKEGEENESADENDDDAKEEEEDKDKDDDDDVKDDDDDDNDKKKNKKRKNYRRNKKSRKSFRDELDGVAEEEVIKESILPVSASFWKRAPHARRPYSYPFPIVVD